MLLRFDIREATNSGAPDYNYCGQAISVFSDYTDIECIIKVDGVEVVNTQDLASTLNFVPAITPKNNNVVSATLEDTHYVTLQIDMPHICSSASVEILINKFTFATFYNNFTIFNYDIGNNPNISINHNIPFYIVLVQVLNLPNRDIIPCVSHFIGWRKPFTNDLYVFKNHSNPSIIEYFKNGQSVGISNNAIICANEQDLISANALCNPSSNCGCNGPSQNSCSSITSVFDYLHHQIPTWETYIANSNGCNNDTSCLVKDQESLATTYINFNTIAQIYINDELTNPFSNVQLTYSLYNSTEDLVQEQTTTIDTLMYPISFNPLTNQFSFILPNLGANILVVKLEDDCWICEKSYTLCTKDVLDISVSDCNKVKICNYDIVPRFINIIKFIDETTNEIIIENLEITPCTCYETILGDGVYTINLVDSEYFKVIHLWCAVKDCLRDFALQLACNKNPCTKIDAAYNFNAAVVLMFTYMAYINKYYNYNILYNELSPSLVTDFININKIIERFKEYCEECRNGNNPCGCD